MDENYSQNSFNQQPTGQPENKDGMATAILVLGILSIVCCAPCGIVSLVLRSSNKDLISPEKQGMVQAGFITSIIGIVLWCIGIVVYMITAAAGFAMYA